MSKSRKTSVIVVDDDISVCRALKTQLVVLGFKVAVFHDAEAMLARGLPHRETCVLSDVYLPGMSGIELCRHLRESGTHFATILMTGRDDEPTRRQMRAAKPMACLFKPFDETALLRAVRNALRTRSKG